MLTYSRRNGNGLTNVPMRIKEIFIALLQFSLDTRDDFPYVPNAFEWKSVMDLARLQTVLGIAFMGIKKIMGDEMSTDTLRGTSLEHIPEDLLLQWMGEAMVIEQKNMEVDACTIQVQEILQKDGFATSILKGQGLRSLYGNLCQMRYSGDIDVWVNSSCSNVLKYVCSRTPNTEFDWKHAHFLIFPSVSVELHWWVSRTYNPVVDRRLRKFYVQEVVRQCSNVVSLPGSNGKIFCPDVYFNSIYVLLHIFDHFLYEGVSFRQLMDYYFVIIQPEVQQRKLEIIQKYKEFGVYEFSRMVAFVLHKAFGLPSDLLLTDSNIKEGEKLLDEIFSIEVTEDGKSKETTCRRFASRMARKFRLLRYNPLSVVCSPFIKLKLILWKRNIIRQYQLKDFIS